MAGVWPLLCAALFEVTSQVGSCLTLGRINLEELEQI